MKIKYFLSSLVVLLVMNSCSDELDNGYQVSEGDVIQLSAYIKGTNSRTSYGELSNGEWPIYWENGDEVLVYCPQAHSDGENIAKYTVEDNTNVGSSNDKDTYKLEGLNTLKWGASDIHHFYTFYPADRVFTQASVSGKDEGTMVFSVNREQTAKVYDKDNDGYMDYAVDMNSAVMAGHITYNRTQVTDETLLSLPFEPISTALDIKIVGPQTLQGTENQYESITITGITVSDAERSASATTPIAGGFYWNHYNKSFEEFVNTDQNVTTDGTASTVHVTFEQPITLPVVASDATPKELTVTTFLLPQIPEKLQITVHCDGNNGLTANLTRTVTKSSNADGNKCSIAIGKLPNPVTFTYESWMASLDDNTYVSQISMPGTHDAGAYESGNIIEGMGQCQQLNIIEQLNAGIRVLDFRPQWQADSDTDVNGVFSIAHGIIDYAISFDDVMDQVLVWLAEHPTEFVIVKLKNEYGTGDATSSANQTEFFGWQRNIRKKIETINPNYVIEKFDPSMTLGEGRGKLLFMSRDYYVPSNMDADTWESVKQAQINDTYVESTYADWLGCKISGWVDNNNYSWKIMTRDYDKYWTKSFLVGSPQQSVGSIVISDMYKATAGTAPHESSKKDCILSTLKDAYDPNNSKDVSKWYVNYLNGTFTARTVSTYNEYMVEQIGYLSKTTYQKTGIVMLDWAAPSKTHETNNYKGFEVIEAVINNNWLSDGKQGPSIKITK